MMLLEQALLVAFLLKCAPLEASGELIPFEPVQYIKFQVSPGNSSSIWNVFREADPQQVAKISTTLKRNSNQLQDSGVSILFAKGERIIWKVLSSKSAMDRGSPIPYANLVAVLSTSMTILLENFQHQVISEPIGEILKGEDLASPIIEGYESKSFLDLLNLHSDSDSVPLLDSPSLKSLDMSGEVAMYFLNSILSDTAKEAWSDALLAYNIEHHVMEANQLKLSLSDLFQYVVTVNHDLQMLQAAPEPYTPAQNKNYLFGWWLNCPKTTGQCMFPQLPKDLIFSASSTLHMYVSPSHDLSMIIHHPHSEGLVQLSKNIWNQVYSALSPATDSTDASSKVMPNSEDGGATEQANSTGFTVELIRQTWPILLFVFWVMSSHVWVYWLFHCCWFLARKVSGRTHIDRPKVAGGN